MPATSSDESLLAEVAAQGRQVTARYIRELRLRDVIASGGTGGRGRVTEYPPGTAEVVCAIVDASADHPKRFHRAVLTAWWRGVNVGDRALRRAFRHELSTAADKYTDASYGQRFRATDHLGALLPGVPKPERATFLRELAKAAVDGTDADSSLLRSLATTFLALTLVALYVLSSKRSDTEQEPVSVPVDEDVLSLVLSDLDLIRAALVARTISREQLDAARDQVRALHSIYEGQVGFKLGPEWHSALSVLQVVGNRFPVGPSVYA